MANFSTDEDLLKYEPRLFTVEQHPSQKLSAGADGVVSHSGGVVKFNSATGAFVNAGMTSGHVVYLFKSSGSTVYFDQALPVAAVKSASGLTLEAKTAACPSATSVTYRVCTFDPQHENMHFELMEHFSLDDGDLDTDNDEADLYNRRQLRDVSTFGVLESVYYGQAKHPDDANWAKASGYRLRYETALNRVKLQLDTDADSNPDVTKRGGSVRLIVGGSGDAWPTQSFSTPGNLSRDVDSTEDAKS
jgi:hypothetical protein